MSPLATAAFASVNLPFTVLLVLVLLYWVTVMLGILDIDALDVDLGAESDVEADADLTGSSIGMSVLKFFYVGEMPLMVLLSIFSLSAWVISVLGNHYLNPGLGLVMGLALLVPNLIGSALLVKVVGKPFSKLFIMLNKDLKADMKMVGLPCVVTTSKVDEKFGQAKVETETSPILFNAITRNREVLKKGDAAVILEHIKEKNIYIITSLD